MKEKFSKQQDRVNQVETVLGKRTYVDSKQLYEDL